VLASARPGLADGIFRYGECARNGMELPKRRRGRPRKPNALSNAERQRRWRRRRAAERKAHPPRVIIDPTGGHYKFQLWDRTKTDYADTSLWSARSLDEMRGKGWRMGYGKTLKDAIERFRRWLKKNDSVRWEEERSWFETHGGYKIVDSGDLPPDKVAQARSWLEAALTIPRISYDLTPEQIEKAHRIAAVRGLPPPHIENGKLIGVEGGPRLCLTCKVRLELWPQDLSVRCPQCSRVWIRTEVDRQGNVRIRNREIDRQKHLGIASPPDYRWKRPRRYSN
jgi:hypothetical protein